MPLTVSAPANFAPLSAVSFGRTGSDAQPVDAANPLPVTRSIALDERLLREGEPFVLYGNNAGAAVSVAAGSVNTVITSTAGQLPQVGRVFYAEAARYSLDQPAMAQFGIAPDAAGRFSGLYDQQIVGANQVVTLPLRQFIRASEFAASGPSINVRNTLTGGAVSYRGAVSVIGRLLTDDLNFAAAHPILVAGDSISAGTGATRTATMYHFVVRDWLNADGYDCRLILKAKSGSNAAEHEGWRAAGWHRPVGRARMGWYALGTNDAAQAVAPAAFVANLTAYWTWWRSLYPAAPLIVLAPPPIANATYEAAAAAIRTATASYVAGVGSPLLRFVDFGAAWTATDAAKTTDGIHPNDAGHALLANALISALQTTGVRPA